MQIVSSGDNLHEMSNPIFWRKKEKYIKMSSAEFLPSMQSIDYDLPSVVICPTCQHAYSAE